MTVTGTTSAAPLGAQATTTPSSPPPADLVGVLQQLVTVLQGLISVLQQQLPGATAPAGPGGATAGAANLPPGGGPVDAQASGGGGGGGCGCGGAHGAANGSGALGAPPASANGGGKGKGKGNGAGAAGAPPAPQGNLVSGPGKHTPKENAQVVAQVAREKGVDPVLAVAMMLVESGGDNTNRTGDGGTSFGLFQLHMGGMLPKDWYPGKPGHQNVFDPRRNAEISLASLARYAKETGKTGGALAAASQRPADPAGYARKVDGMMDEARKLLGG